MFNQIIVGERLKALRKEKGISQTALGNVIGITKASVSDLEHGRQSTTLENLYILAQYLDTTSDYLLGLSNGRERK